MVRIGIIGYGGMGGAHANYLGKGEVPNATLAAICDTAPDALERARQKFGDAVRYFDSADALMDSGAVDAVMVATPHYFHPPLAIAALNKGLHALVEKPAGVYTKQVREMNAVASKSDRVFGIMFNQRTRPLHQKMREIVASGELGELRRTHYVITNWFRTQAYYDSGGWRATWSGEGGGVLVNQCPHNLDLWQWICGMPRRVRAFCGFGKRHDIEVEDEVTAYVEYENGATGVFITSTGEAPGSYQFDIVGDHGRLSIEDNKLVFRRTVQSVNEFLKTSKQGFATPETWRCEIPVGGGAGDEHKGVTTNWVKAITDGTPLLAPGQEGVNGVELANAMLLSAWTDAWVNLPIDEELFLSTLQEKVRTSAGKRQPEGGKPMDFSGTF